MQVLSGVGLTPARAGYRIEECGLHEPGPLNVEAHSAGHRHRPGPGVATGRLTLGPSDRIRFHDF